MNLTRIVFKKRCEQVLKRVEKEDFVHLPQISNGTYNITALLPLVIGSK